jgi:hypothetical protein
MSAVSRTSLATSSPVAAAIATEADIEHCAVRIDIGT